jgi:hypothetical protein
MAKCNVDMASRRILGYHSAGSDQSVLIYSRDGMSGPLRDLDKVMVLVQTGAFVPDASRSGRMVPESGRLPIGISTGEETEIDKDCVLDGLEESSGTDSSDDDDEESEPDAVEGKALDEAWPQGFMELFDAGYVLYRHRYFKTLHWAVTDEAQSFACGRVISQACTLVMTEAALDKPVCSQCGDATGYRELWDKLGV